MKKTLQYIFATILLSFPFVALADNDEPYSGYHQDNNIATSKKVTNNGDGSYKISLETFATGSSTKTTTSTPVDIVLVLDYSGSMSNDYNGTTRIAALKKAVSSFISQIHNNDVYKDGSNNKTRRASELGNRIAIVTFSGRNSSRGTDIITSSLPGVENGGFIPTADTAYVDNLIEAVYDANQGTGTRTDLGMNLGSTLISNSKTSKPNSNRVLVVFSDGEPSPANDYSVNTPVTDLRPNTVNIANDAITLAKRVKDNGATVYSIGLITENKSVGTITTVDFLKYLSSLYPDAESITVSGSPATSGTYYFDAQSMNLDAVFESIATASGGTEKPIGTDTQIRDVVTSSFTLPKDMKVSDISYSVWKIDSDGDSWTEDTSYDKTGIAANFGKKSYTQDGKEVQLDTVGVTGFYFSENDTQQSLNKNEADGNWVGQRYKMLNGSATSEQYYAGRKLVIEFNVYPADDITGGATQTNTEASGVYVKNADGKYDCLNSFTIPDAVLSINIEIQKSGLRRGESATFEIWRAYPMKNDKGEIVYNALGKPKPEEDAEGNILWGKPDYRSNKYNAWSKVVITNKTDTDGATVVERLVALDPNYIYKVVEDDWGWAYTVTAAKEGDYSTSNTITNPFIFTNKEKKDVVKHAEAVTINHFATSATANNAYEEHYKSSKVKSF